MKLHSRNLTSGNNSIFRLELFVALTTYFAAYKFLFARIKHILFFGTIGLVIYLAFVASHSSAFSRILNKAYKYAPIQRTNLTPGQRRRRMFNRLTTARYQKKLLLL
jgi:hypothetical protein